MSDSSDRLDRIEAMLAEFAVNDRLLQERQEALRERQERDMPGHTPKRQVDEQISREHRLLRELQTLVATHRANDDRFAVLIANNERLKEIENRPRNRR